jgi:hypothetical protein
LRKYRAVRRASSANQRGEKCQAVTLSQPIIQFGLPIVDKYEASQLRWQLE